MGLGRAPCSAPGPDPPGGTASLVNKQPHLVPSAGQIPGPGSAETTGPSGQTPEAQARGRLAFIHSRWPAAAGMWAPRTQQKCHPSGHRAKGTRHGHSSGNPLPPQTSPFLSNKNKQRFMIAPVSEYARILGRSTTSVWPGNSCIFLPRTQNEYWILTKTSSIKEGQVQRTETTMSSGPPR